MPSPHSPRRLDTLLDSLYRRINYERRLKVMPRHFKLQNMREFLKRLGNPHLDYPVIHVAGTKGKGSVVTMVGQILQASGRRTGVYLSPHLETIHQRMAIDGQLISDQQLANVLAEIEPVANEIDREADARNQRALTFFEVITAAAFCYYSQQKADAVVLEVGLGGRLDSTNVCQPSATIITNISFDHTRQLGTTLEKIAHEKCGIIKPGVPVVSGAIDADAAKVVATIAQANDSPLMELARDFRVVDHAGENHADDNHVAEKRISEKCSANQQSDSFHVVGRLPNGKPFSVPHLVLGLLGDHQRSNAAVAVATIEQLNEQGWEVEANAIRTGLAKASLTGRTEQICLETSRGGKAKTGPVVLLDIAHNVASVDALVTTLDQRWPQQSHPRRTLIFACSQEKDVAGMLQVLLPGFDRFLITRYQDNPRGMEADKVAEIARAVDAESNGDSAREFSLCATPQEAWQQALAANPDLICIAGSAFLVAELRPTVIEEKQKSHERSVEQSSALG